MKTLGLLLFIVLSLVSLFSAADTFALSDFNDSTKSVPAEKLSHWRFTARVHTKGVFTYGGRLGTDNPAFDVNFTYERKNWGLLVFKGVDLRDHSTFYNFSLVSLYKNFKVSPRVTMTPYLGSFLEQANAFADHGSDVVGILITSVKLNPHFTFEYMDMFSNLIVEPGEMDWVNRFRLTYTGKHWDVVSTLWYNTDVFDSSSYWTAGLNIAYSRMKVADHVYLSAGMTYLALFRTSDESLNPSANHLTFTLAAQLVR